MRKSDIRILLLIAIAQVLSFGAGMWIGYKIEHNKYQPNYEHPTEASKEL